MPTDMARIFVNRFPVSTAGKPKGSALDLGTGSGVIAIFLHLLGFGPVTASDINSVALSCLKQNLQLNHLSKNAVMPVLSDMFEKMMDKKYDLIVTNPPLLPDIPEIRLNQGLDYALLSGDEGRTFIDRFLLEIPRHLSDSGRVFIIHSSLNNIQKTETILINNGYSVSTLHEERVSFAYSIYANSKGLLRTKLLQLRKEGKAHFDPDTMDFQVRLIEARKLI